MCVYMYAPNTDQCQYIKFIHKRLIFNGPISSDNDNAHQLQTEKLRKNKIIPLSVNVLISHYNRQLSAY